MVSKVLIFIICVFLIAFPKGGIKIGSVPVTWGYILLALYTAFSTFFAINSNGELYLKQNRRYVLTCCLPFQIYCLVILSFSEIQSVGFLLSFILSVILMPFIFLFFLNKPIDSQKFQRSFIPVFINCIRFVAIFGLVLFFLKFFRGIDFEIPYLTVNIDDVGQISEKFNLRGSITKLISTYNNGNIYGISLMILLPLYLEKEKNVLLKSAVILSMVLTLSRTVWIGLVLYLLFYFITKIRSIKAWLTILGGLIFIAVAGPLILSAMGRNIDFILDKDLGGRAGQLTAASDFSVFGAFKFRWVEEIIYTSILKTFGFIGLIFFLPYLFSPIIIYYINLRKRNSIKKSNAFWGLLLYCILAFSDGAMLYIPVMCFYWFMSSYIFTSSSLVLE
jgi:hypothetical protein